MIRPNKHTNPDLTILNISGLLIKRLKRTKVKSFKELEDIVCQYDTRAKDLFLPTLQFLFVLGVIEYYPKNDKIELISANETE